MGIEKWRARKEAGKKNPDFFPLENSKRKKNKDEERHLRKIKGNFKTNKRDLLKEAVK